ncbi:MAG: sugar transferase [Kiritimatiellia bacterium]|jgi:exopolysaccharide biosynthesis polyprenyl glycosylphosphotransferase
MSKSLADAYNSVIAVLADGLCALVAVFLAVWIRFDSGWFHDSWFQVRFGRPDDVYARHLPLAIAGVVLAYIMLRRLKLYKRPQRGTFLSKIPRLLRGAGLVTISMLVILAVAKNYYNVSAGVVLVFFPCFSLLLIVQRAVIFRLEIRAARRAVATHGLLIIGVDATAAHLMRCYRRDPRLRVNVSGVLTAHPNEKPDASIPAESVLGDVSDFERILDETPNIVQVIVTTPDIRRRRLAEIATESERRMIRFNLVPDMFLIMTSSVEVETVDDIPLLGLKRRPLDKLGNRVVKRLEDILGGIVGLIVSAPIIAVMAVLIKRESKGPVFYTQTRCGYGGKSFVIYKLRSMRVDAERETGAVFAAEDDPRRTRIGVWMRSHNIDELPQFWNVVKGDMSLVGPRPERPEFVEQFASDIAHYMRRHVCRPGITGWAQIHGLRGNTSIEDRLRYDLWYLENWSLALDVKILLRTLFAMNNAY